MPFDLHGMQAGERDRAYVLVHLMKPEVDLARWRAFLQTIEAKNNKGAERGITVAAVSDECLVGLYTWAVQPSLDHRNVFNVDNFIATGALDPEPLFDAMIKKMDAQAHELECGAVQVSVPSIYTGTKQQRLLQDCFLSNGFIVADQKLRRDCSAETSVPRTCGGAPGTKAPDALH